MRKTVLKCDGCIFVCVCVRRRREENILYLKRCETIKGVRRARCRIVITLARKVFVTGLGIYLPRVYNTYNVDKDRMLCYYYYMIFLILYSHSSEKKTTKVCLQSRVRWINLLGTTFDTKSDNQFFDYNFANIFGNFELLSTSIRTIYFRTVRLFFLLTLLFIIIRSPQLYKCIHNIIFVNLKYSILFLL